MSMCIICALLGLFFFSFYETVAAFWYLQIRIKCKIPTCKRYSLLYFYFISICKISSLSGIIMQLVNGTVVNLFSK